MKKILLVALAGSLFSCTPDQKTTESTQETREMTTKTHSTSDRATLLPEITRYINTLEADVAGIDPERKELLNEMAEYVRSERDSGHVAKLTFICTHNSRRSHMSQIWAATLAEHFGISGVETYSGGTEATAFNPRAVDAMERAGFEVSKPEGDNPRYSVRYAESAEPMICFSKKYDDPSNPEDSFAAVMTCSQADETCPFIPGAKFRIPIPYDDPKEADGTPEEAARYDERCRQIATEMFYLFSQVS
jgi:arsenate reductase